MKASKSIKLPLFPVKLTFIAGVNEAKMIGLDFDEKYGACVFYTSAGVFFAISDESQFTNDLITHESVHAAWRALDYVGVVVDVNNQEPLAYLAGHIAREAYLFFGKYYEVSDEV